jgi:hypothetical protein
MEDENTRLKLELQRVKDLGTCVLLCCGTDQGSPSIWYHTVRHVVDSATGTLLLCLPCMLADLAHVEARLNTERGQRIKLEKEYFILQNQALGAPGSALGEVSLHLVSDSWRWEGTATGC